MNLPSIVQLGILSHDRARKVHHASVASNEVQAIRARKFVPRGQRLHQYANLYIDARNPMMYVLKDQHNSLSVLRVSTNVLDLPGVVIADGNAAGALTRFGAAPQGLAVIDRELVFADWWSGNAEAKRVRCAEVLLPDRIPPSYLLGAYVSCELAQRRCNDLDLTNPRLETIVYEHVFYL